ncbi:MAG: dihydroorotate dehydrogenase electron transfer subunit [Prevotellaceae bacterium]|jgi:dihydroorotate dehydrogenase electron transfer subunit|nr:dihydroorotate dehydrogenase electron transfer subunit [Prevotellaceae bacterium]
MKKYQHDLIITANETLNNQYFLLKLTQSEPLPEMQPGQFVQLLIEDSAQTFLRRPISINFVDKAKNELWLLIQKVGNGTRKLAEYQVGRAINVLYPLGNSFSEPLPQQKILLVGGGVGTAPMLMLGASLKAKDIEPTFLLGARSAGDLLQLNEFEKYGRVLTTTEDGSQGEHGFVIQHSVLQNEQFDRICTCGPTPMMKAVAAYAAQRGIYCEVSLENTMACGIGACLCCVQDTVDGHRCVCTDGPVFDAKELKW